MSISRYTSRKRRLLTALGFDGTEVEVYLALLKSGPVTIAELARRAKRARPAVYRALPRLRARGMVGTLPRGKRQLLVAASPEQLTAAFEGLQSEFQAVLPEMLQTYAAAPAAPHVQVLEGASGIRSVMAQVVSKLPKNGVWYRYSSSVRSNNAGDRYLPRGYRELRDRKRLQRFVITNKDRMQQYSNKLDRMVKAVPTKYGLFDYDVSLLIAGDTVAYLDYRANIAVAIDDARIARFHEKLFRILYDRL